MAIAADGAKPLALRPATEKVRSPLGDAWRQFRRNKVALVAVGFIIFLVLTAVGADVLRGLKLIDDPIFQHAGRDMAFAQPLSCSIDARRQNPQYCFVFGTDISSRDNLSRLIYGARTSLSVALVGTITIFVIGVLYGVFAGFYGGRVDNIMMRFVDFLYGVPDLPLIILMQVFLQTLAAYKDQVGPFGQAMVEINNSMGGLFFLFVAIGLVNWIGVARLARGQVLSYKQKEFIEAARSIGARDRRIIFTHLLPNILGPLIVAACLAIPGFIFTEAALSYLGVGVNPPTPSWGQMINAAQEGGYLARPILVLVPTIALGLTGLAFSFIGDGLRDAFDPRLRGE